MTNIIVHIPLKTTASRTMPAEAYTSVPSTGKLKLKGVSDGRIDKKKKKKKSKPETDSAGVENTTATKDAVTFTDNSVVLKSLEDEDAQIQTQKRKDDSAKPSSNGQVEDEETSVEEMNKHLKTASELRFEEQRRKRLEERLKREGVKTHKQRVEELNRYLSGLSEHHDMPKIGPG